MREEAATESRQEPSRGLALAKRLAPVALLGLAAALIFGLGLHKYLTFEALREHRVLLTDYVESNLLQAVALYLAIYAGATALSLPGGAVLSIAGGFLFGAWLGGSAVVVGATVGATAIFLVARSAFGEPLRARAGPTLKKMEAGFQENALSYLLVLRLVPLFPFFLVNLVPAFLGVPLRTYVVGTFFGIIPGCFVFASAGAGLGSVFDSSESFSPASLLTPQVIVALAGLACLALIPVAYKLVKTRAH